MSRDLDEPQPEEPERPRTKPREYPPNDGKRYAVSLATPKNPHHFIQFFESDTEKDAREACTNRACDEERECIVFDRERHEINFRYNGNLDVDEPKEEVPLKKKRKPRLK